MSSHFADRVVEAVAKKQAPACVGLDPLVERFPPDLLREVGVDLSPKGEVAEGVATGAITAALRVFGRAIIELVAPHVPLIKINIAFFERYHAEGVRVYYELVHHAREAGLIVIGDVKRADIGHTSTQYAYGQLVGSGSPAEAAPDAITINPYFGFDGVRPFVEVAKEQNRGLFILVQTSNKSAVEIQGLTLPDGLTVCQHVARLVDTWSGGEGLVGASGYSSIGAVVSPRDLPSTERIRTLMPRSLFLVPGFGAQGRTAQEVARCFKPDGSGAVVTASRSVIYAYQDPKQSEACGGDWRRCVETGAKDFVDAIGTVIRL